MWIFIASVLALKKTLQLRDVSELSSLDRNCSATQSFTDNPAELVGLVAIFRHGDRAPLTVESDVWRKKSCIKCDETCRSQPCSDGMLTKKGYIQAKKLGKYIKKYYRAKFHILDSLTGYHSSYERSISTLHGVLAGLNEWHYEIFRENSIVSASNVKILKNIILNAKLSEFKKRNLQEYKIYDEIIADFCSETPFSCSKFSCDPKKILSFVTDQQNDLLEYVNLIRSNIMAMGITLGEFGEFLKKEMLKRRAITLISGHDSLIVKILSSLNADIKKLPSYTSAVFLEIWKDKHQNEFVRMVYDGSVEKFGLYNEEYVSFDNFIKYIDMFNNANRQIGTVINGDTQRLLTNNEIRQATAITYNAYAPLVDAIQRNRVSVKPTNKFLASNLSKTEESGEDLYDPISQFLSPSTKNAREPNAKPTSCENKNSETGNEKSCNSKVDGCAVCTRKCEDETKTSCEKKCPKNQCGTSCKSEFASRPGTCAVFGSTSCEECKRPAQPCNSTSTSCNCRKPQTCSPAKPQCADSVTTNPPCVGATEDDSECSNQKFPETYALK
ncbi:uncharacterized protein VICG_01065 [Vittaforma corneae ATCC 50505]|uniref:Histidine acid phosphatase n=1 Tax=Vittaforma corneae (strain ATCC 50505) TaxID=993615 RepID=L2GM08_VITCO|nr:uncharacterized protein VICG_01065 [Vittaforma corneae ATCC 50505]ELA41881.1 hypothetical protein VICG_01065 [Vittaforma corneae ATCC 50505]